MYEWWMERTFDQKVKDYLRTSVGPEYVPIHGHPTRDPIPRSLSEISKGSGVGGWWVKGCLNRLKRKDVITQDGDRWKLLS
jgi:hypothetical protein